MRRSITVPLCVAATLIVAGCARHDRRIQQHQEALESLSATARAVTDAWLGGNVSGTYTRTALEETFLLVEQERTALASQPGTIIDPRGARLADAADALARMTAHMIADVRAADAVAARRHLAALPLYSSPTRQ